MIVVTGGFGFIGSNLVRKLYSLGYKDICVVDNLNLYEKFHNLSDIPIERYYNRNEFLKLLKSREVILSEKDVIVHLGACSATTEKDLEYLMSNNFNYSKALFQAAQEVNCKFIYASSASVYGLGLKGFSEQVLGDPINGYAYTKFLFDNVVENFLATDCNMKVFGLRFFNVYGPREEHKKSMRSVIRVFWEQAHSTSYIKLFGRHGGYDAGEQQRDFVHVDDCVEQMIYLIENEAKSGIYNCGTGVARSFNSVAEIFKDWFKVKMRRSVQVQYVEFPDSLKGGYQSYTQADTAKCKENSVYIPKVNIEDGIIAYLDWLDTQN